MRATVPDATPSPVVEFDRVTVTYGKQHAVRDVVQGFLAFVRLQAGSRTQLDGMLDGFQLTSGGTTVTLSFDLSPEMFELAFPEDPDAR